MNDDMHNALFMLSTRIVGKQDVSLNKDSIHSKKKNQQVNVGHKFCAEDRLLPKTRDNLVHCVLFRALLSVC